MHQGYPSQLILVPVFSSCGYEKSFGRGAPGPLTIISLSSTNLPLVMSLQRSHCSLWIFGSRSTTCWWVLCPWISVNRLEILLVLSLNTMTATTPWYGGIACVSKLPWMFANHWKGTRWWRMDCSQFQIREAYY